MMGHGLGSVTSDVLGGGDAGLGPPVSGVSPHRPLLLRSDVPWTPEGSAREPSAGSASASSGSGLTVSLSYRPLRSQSGGAIGGCMMRVWRMCWRGWPSRLKRGRNMFSEW